MKIDRVLRYTGLLLVFSIFSQSMAFARKPLDGPAIREKIAAIGEGHQCRLKLADGSQAKGAIVNIHADNLTLKTKGVKDPRRIDYAQITGIHRAGRMSDAKVPIIVGTVAAGVIIGMAIWAMYVWTHGHL
jgi:hypothetical protein